MRGPEEWPSSGSNPADRIRLTGPAALIFFLLLTSSNFRVWRKITCERVFPTAWILLTTYWAMSSTSWLPIQRPLLAWITQLWDYFLFARHPTTRVFGGQTEPTCHYLVLSRQ
jgi:hypothetical protein